MHIQIEKRKKNYVHGKSVVRACVCFTGGGGGTKTVSFLFSSNLFLFLNYYSLHYAVTVSVQSPFDGNVYGFCFLCLRRSRRSPITKRKCSNLPRVRKFWSSLVQHDVVVDAIGISPSSSGSGADDVITSSVVALAVVVAVVVVVVALLFDFRATRLNSGAEHNRSFKMCTIVATSRRGRPFGSWRAGFRAPLNVPEYTLPRWPGICTKWVAC